MLDVSTYQPNRTGTRRRMALVAHASRRAELLDWARSSRDTLRAHDILSTGTIRALLVSELGLNVIRIPSGPLDGHPRLDNVLPEERIDFVVFFWDPLEPHPRDGEARMLLRAAVAARIPIACTRASADYMISAPLAHDEYARRLPTFDERLWHPEIALAAHA